jgi:hypothetical protein
LLPCSFITQSKPLRTALIFAIAHDGKRERAPQIMDDRFSTHPLWEHDVDLAMEGLEKYVLSVPEVCARENGGRRSQPANWSHLPAKRFRFRSVWLLLCAAVSS